MDKYAIAFTESNLAATGGPAGYLYNLKTGLSRISNDQVIFIPPTEKGKVGLPPSLKKMMPMRLRQLHRLHYYLGLLQTRTELPEEFNNASTIHFHSPLDLYLARYALEGYGGKVVLTSHSPKVGHREVFDLLSEVDLNRNMDKLEELQWADEYAFTRADCVVFPCREAEECYFNTWKKYKDIRKRMRVEYLPTGIKDLAPLMARKAVREKYGIPEDAFVVSYVGRHNEVKGFSTLLEVAKDVLRDDNIWFLIAGAEEPLKGLQHDRWIEAGWTNDPHSLIHAADVFVLPNKQTYFDLVLLEVMCLGLPIIASRTGGNKYFEKYSQKGQAGIVLYDGEEELVREIERLKNMDRNELCNMSSLNRKLYVEEFSCEVFAENYIALMSRIAS